MFKPFGSTSTRLVLLAVVAIGDVLENLVTNVHAKENALLISFKEKARQELADHQREVSLRLRLATDRLASLHYEHKIKTDHITSARNQLASLTVRQVKQL